MAKTKDGNYQTTVRFDSESDYNDFIKLCEHLKNSQNGTVNYCIKEVFRQTFKS
jgi:hypothetical protein